MKAGAGRAIWWLLLGVSVLAGCAIHQPYLDQALLAERGGADRNRGVLESYLVGCPDVLEVRIHGHPDGIRREVGPDGRIALGSAGRVRVEGLTAAAAARQVAEELELAPERVSVQVAEHRSQQVYLFGEVVGLQRAVPYQGPETVLDLLQRTGGITPGAAVGDVYVVRAQVAESKPPEVYHIDLKGIVMHDDERTNLRLQPFDRIYVGETRKSCLAKCLSPCLRPLFEKCCGLKR